MGCGREKEPWSTKPSKRLIVESQPSGEPQTLRLFWVMPLIIREFLLSQSRNRGIGIDGLGRLLRLVARIMRCPKGGKGRLANRQRGPRLRLDHSSHVGRPDAADEAGRAIRI